MRRQIIRLFFAIIIPVVISQRHNALPSSSECGVLREDQFYNLQKIVEDKEFPWRAKLFNINETLICMSVLISKQYLLAPATCFDLANISAIELGNCKRKKQCTVRHELDTFIQHPRHVPGGLVVTYDIGLLRMKEPVIFTDYIQPICLPGADVVSMDLSAQHTILTGKQVLGGLDGKLVALIVSLTRCQKLYKIFDINDYVLCASTCDNGSKYISGSILMGTSVKYSLPDHYYLIGLLTFGSNGCFDSSPDIFQRIDRHLDWIIDSINKLEGT